MIIAQAQDLEQRFGGNTIFSNISFSVPDNSIASETLFEVLSLCNNHSLFSQNLF